MNAIWGLDYDLHMDKCYKRPCCPECEAPIFKDEKGAYRCVNCQHVIKIIDDDMMTWLKVREETKVELEDCPKITTKDGKHLSGCGGKKCMEVHYRRNPITLEWQQAYGQCRKCETRFIV